MLDNLLLTYDVNQIEELIMEDHNIEEVRDDLKDRVEMLVHLECLGMNRCNLSSLRNLPYLRKLQRFTADGNKLKTRHVQYILDKYPELTSLSLV
jgi:Leucine-rich repeat (LRR) protein